MNSAKTVVFTVRFRFKRIHVTFFLETYAIAPNPVHVLLPENQSTIMANISIKLAAINCCIFSRLPSK